MLNKIALLKSHSIKFKFIGSDLMIWDDIIQYPNSTNGLKEPKDLSKWVDITDWSIMQVFEFLGY